MAPEQLQGAAADARSDVFAFGPVLFEMLTGRRAFDADSPAGIIAAVLSKERPSGRALRPGLPSALERLIGACLALDPAERWQAAHDIALHLADIRGTEPATDTRRPRLAAIVTACALGLVVGVGATVGWWRLSASPPVPRQIARLSLALANDTVLAPNDGPAAGSTEGGMEPVWSRNGRELFYRNGRQFLAASVNTAGGVDIGRPKVLFEGDFVFTSLVPGAPSYDVALDCQRFLMVARAGDQPLPRQLEVVLNWTEELSRRGMRPTTK